MTDNGAPTLMLVDGLSMAYRAFFALPVENFSTSTGQPTNAVYGFTTMLAGLMRDHQPSHIAVAFDLPGGTFRTQRLPSYKGTRDETPADFEAQVPLIRQMLSALRVTAVDMPNYEADDLLATYARLGTEADMRVLVVSGDRDSLQLVSNNVTVLYPRKGVSDLVHMTPQAVIDKYDVEPGRYPDLAALVGETSDNLPGVPGVGPKTAAKWIRTYGGLEGIVDRADDIPGKAGQSLRDHLDQVKINRELNHLLTDLDVTVPVDQMVYQGANAADIHDICDALQFRTLRDRLLPLAPDAHRPEPDSPVDVVVDDAVAQVTSITDAVVIHVDGRTGAEADAWALGVAHADQAWGIDLTGLDADQEARLGAWLADASVPVSMHAAKDAWHALSARGFTLAGVVADTQIAAFLVNPDQRDYSLSSVLQRFTGISDDIGEAADELDLGLGASAAVVAGRRAAAVSTLAAALEQALDERGMADLYRDIEIPLIPVLAAMEEAGIAVDVEHLGQLSDAALRRATTAAEQAYAAIGTEVNLGSPKQLQEVLFGQLGMPKTKRIKTGYTTDASSLVELQAKNPHPFLEALLEHRDATKLAQIIDTLAGTVRTDTRIHTSFSQTVAATGRLSSRDPNLQNIPIRTAEGHRIREAFVVGDGYEVLMTADYSQIEMRIMAHLSGDAGLIDAFVAGEDLHRFVGARVFGVEPADVTPPMRAKVKAMSYGLAYGLSAFGLARQLSVPVAEAQRLMDDYFERFGAVRTYLRTVVEQARQDGYTETILGRRRYIPDLRSTNRQRREIAERMALNAPIQGSAADVIKMAMLGVQQALTDAGLSSRQLLQVHDELVLEVAPGEATQVEDIVTAQMGSAVDLRVPLEVNIGWGGDWRSAGH